MSVESMSLSRFQITQGCPNLPGKCAACGSSTGEMVDFGLDMDFYGTVYLCRQNCFQEMANRFGYFSPGQVKHIEDQYAILVDKVLELETQNAGLNNVLVAVHSLRSTDDVSVSPDQLVLNLEFTEPVGETPEPVEPEQGPVDGASKSVSKRTSSGSRRKAGPAKQDDEQRPADVHSNDSLSSAFPDSI